MNKRLLLANRPFYIFVQLVLLVLLALLVSLPALASDKKGVGLAHMQAPDRIAALAVAWYYTWKPHPIPGVEKAEFVPMLRSRGGRVLDKQIGIIQSMGKVPVLLAFNEPNKSKGDNMSVEDVLRVWPEIEPLAARLSSPAPAGVLGPWFDKFYRLAKTRGLNYDFMAVHLYGAPDPEEFLRKIDTVYEKYGVPIWITEFAVADWEAKDRPGSNRYSDEQVLAFMKAVLPELEKRNFVERYAWFGAGGVSLTHEQVRTSRLFNRDGTLTELGCYYSQFSWPQQTLQKSSCRSTRVNPLPESM